MQGYISKQITKFNLQAGHGHAKSIDMTQY
jgi:hypothetical protein